MLTRLQAVGRRLQAVGRKTLIAESIKSIESYAQYIVRTGVLTRVIVVLYLYLYLY